MRPYRRSIVLRNGGAGPRRKFLQIGPNKTPGSNVCLKQVLEVAGARSGKVVPSGAVGAAREVSVWVLHFSLTFSCVAERDRKINDMGSGRESTSSRDESPAGAVWSFR